MSETVTHYFFDTSALVKRYHDEVGTAAVDEAFDDEDAFCLISDLTVIECHSAFAKQADAACNPAGSLLVQTADVGNKHLFCRVAWIKHRQRPTNT